MNPHSDLEQFARTLLFGRTLEEKLITLPSGWNDLNRGPALELAPIFPGRPTQLARIGKAEFPKMDQLKLDSTRGQILHFFANHELLAMELMALVLLKFPEAPPAFRASMAATVLEEQSHLRLYIARMRELGVDFGELPVSEYFWKSMSGMKSPLEFVTQMSLTLEQANLDFSLYYREKTAEIGDAKTACILDQVYREEIGHVKNGLAWFNRWRAVEAAGQEKVGQENVIEDDWAAYLRILPPPMTPRRAKGIGFSIEARRAAGLSERFIVELEVYSGSKGRPPVMWFYNPLCDSEIARGKPGLSPAEPVRRLGLDLEHLPMFLASDKDVVLVNVLPRAEWLKHLQLHGFKTPEFRKCGLPGETPRELKIGGLEPWGWSPETFERFKPWRDRLVKIEGGNGPWCEKLLKERSYQQTQLGRFFSKAWSVGFLREWILEHPADQAIFGGHEQVGDSYPNWAPAQVELEKSLQGGGPLLLAKAPWGTSGMQNKRILKKSEIDGNLGGWIQNTIASQGSVILEPWLDKIADLSMQIEVTDEQTRILGIRRFVTGSRLEYRGTYLDPKLTHLSPECHQFLQNGVLERWHHFARELGTSLREGGYRGPAGLDAMLWRESDGKLRFKPLVELNPRWTMGRVAIELEAHLLPGVPAAWAFLSLHDTDRARLAALHPAVFDGQRLAQGLFLTSDPERAREIITVLAAGKEAVDAVLPIP